MLNLKQNTTNNKHDDILNYVSNTDKDIYTISSLPEEIIAVIFAYVSRSPKSFRENLLKVSKEKAASFHEKWVLQYGHASVAELASVHIGIEKVSRLFSAILERSNLYISPIEYSQRYQKPKKEHFYYPSNKPINKNIYNNYQNSIYNIYETILNKLIIYYQKNEKPKKNENKNIFKNRIEKMSFEDARYILTLATYTNLGLSANARACEDMIKTLLASEYNEVKNRAKEIKKEISKNLPTLIKYAKKNNFISKSRQLIKKEIHKLQKPIKNEKTTLNAKLLSFTGSENKDPENYTLNTIIEEMLYPYSEHNIQNIKQYIKNMDKKEKITIYKNTFEKLKSHDNPINTLENINYNFELHMSEACWHQFLRHRKINFTPQYPNIHNGYIIPESIKKANLINIFKKGIKKSEELFKLLNKSKDPISAHYAVTNSHIRKVIASFSLWELYHIINLRMKPEAQWEIRTLLKLIVNEINSVHPNLIIPALNRLKKINTPKIQTTKEQSKHPYHAAQPLQN